MVPLADPHEVLRAAHVQGPERCSHSLQRNRSDYRRPTPASSTARFSTTGPDVFDGQMTPADVLKPDIVAPGEQIWAGAQPAYWIHTRKWFDISPAAMVDLEIRFKVTRTSDSVGFWEIVFTRSLDHTIRLPLAVLPTALR